MFIRVSLFLLFALSTSTAIAAPAETTSKSAELTRAMDVFDDVEATLAQLMKDLPEIDLGRTADNAAEKDVSPTYALRDYQKSPIVAPPRGFDLSAL